MHQFFLKAISFLLICLFLTACVVQVHPIPVLEVHPLSLELYD